MKNAVIIDTFPDDIHAHSVAWSVSQNEDWECFHIYADNFPSKSMLSIAMTMDDLMLGYEGPEAKIDLTKFDQITYIPRRCKGPRISNTVHSDDMSASYSENISALSAFRYILTSLPNVISINNLASKRRADQKPLQLYLAKKAGLVIPNSLFSNNPNDIKKMLNISSDRLAYKTYTPCTWRQEYDSSVRIFMKYTNLISKSVLSSDQVLRDTSGIFQNYIEKHFEVRLVCMGSQFFGSKIDSQKNILSKVDWRNEQEKLAVESIKVPLGIQESMINLMTDIGIIFCTADFIVTPEGEWIFLEVNEQGQWLWQEEACSDLPILDAYTEFVKNPSTDFRYTTEKKIFSFEDYKRYQWNIDYQKSIKLGYEDNGSHITLEKFIDANQ